MSCSKSAYGLTLLLCCAVLCLFFCPAAALAEEGGTKFKVSGDLDVAFNFGEGLSFDAERDVDQFSVPQRFRIFPSAIVNDELSFHALIRIKPDRWGDNSTPNSGYNIDGDGNVFLTRFLFANWRPYENTVVHMGIIPLALPIGAYRNGVLDTSIGGVSAEYTFKPGIKIKAAWGRAYDKTDRAVSRGYDDTDIFVLMAPLEFKDKGINFAPWGIYANIGKDSDYWNARVPHISNSTNPVAGKNGVDDNGKGFWAGFAAKYALGDFTLKADFAYGQIETSDSRGKYNYNTEGWHAALKAEYKTGFGVPSLFGWYSTGSDADDVAKKNTWGHLPAISTFGDGFAPTSLGFPGGESVNTAGLVSYLPSGKWGVGAEITRINFVENLNHTIRVAYYRGTNDNELAKSNPRENLANTTRDFVLMVKGDYIIEVNFDHCYDFSDKVQINLALGYMNIERTSEWGKQRDLDDVYAASLGFTYKY